MSLGWTGGQYSVFRGVFGCLLFVEFARALLRSAPQPWFLGLFLGIGCVLALLFAAGWADRVAAIGLGGLLAGLFGRDPFGDGLLPIVLCWLLLAHAMLPSRPYGSLSARGRPDPGAGWTMPVGIHRAAWGVLVLGYGLNAYQRLTEPAWIDGSALALAVEGALVRPGALGDLLKLLPDGVLRAASYGTLAVELAFVPLAAVGRIRPWIWSLLLTIHLARIVFSASGDLGFGLAAAHVFAFNPGWIAPRPARGPSLLFYDGHCGLCHRWVRFLLAEDPDGRAFRFAPLGGAAFRRRVSPEDRPALPDSLIVVPPTGELLTRSRGVRHVLSATGGSWRILAILLGLVPRVVLDLGYDGVAAIRHRLFRRPDETCPLLTPGLSARFDDVGIDSGEGRE